MIFSRLLVLPVLAVAVVALADDQSEIKSIHDRFTKAALANKVPLMLKVADAVTTSDFVVIEKGKKITKEQWLETIKGQMGQVKITKWVFTLKNLKVKGNSASVVTTLAVSGQISDPNTGKSVSLDSVSVSNETLAKVNGRWKMRKLDSISDKTLIGGKPVG
jgi:hypothetical protein